GIPQDGECIILKNAALLLNITIGDDVHLEYDQYQGNYTVTAICEQIGKFMEFETSAVVLNLQACQNFFNRPGKINHIMGRIEYGEEIYDSRSIRKTTNQLKKIASNVQDRLDLNEYQVVMPKLEILKNSEFILELLSVLFWLIAIFSMLVTGILINSILTTSIEDKIREFGILQILGSRKSFIFRMVLFEGFLYGLLGTIIGMLSALFIGLPSIISLIEWGNPEGAPIIYIIYPETILISLLIGIIVPLLISLLPAIKSVKKDLVYSLSPLQKQQEGWEVKKEGSINLKNSLAGLAIASVGLIIFIMLPQILVIGNIVLISLLFIGLLSAILIGLVLVFLGIIPLIQYLFLRFIRPFIKKYANLIKISLRRNRRRNTSTIIMFALSFSFIFFITGINEMESQNLSYTLDYLYGSDVVIINQGYEADKDAVTLEMVKELPSYNQIEGISYCLHNTFDLQAAISLFSVGREEEPKFIEDMTVSQIDEMLQFYQYQSQDKRNVTIGDMVEYQKATSVGFVGIHKSFLETVQRDKIFWNSLNSGFNRSFSQIFTHNDSCIIATSIADLLGVKNVGEQVRLTVYNPYKENDRGTIHTFTVAGISGGIPGFWNFRSAEYFAQMGGVMVSLDTYIKLMNVSKPMQDKMIVDKIFLDLYDDSEDATLDFMELIEEKYHDKDFVIDDVISKINFLEEATEDANSVIELIFLFTVLTANFGLLSTMYAIIYERRFEIFILRSLGLRKKDIKRKYLIENLIVLLSAGIVGVLIGTLCAYLLLSNIAALIEVPLQFIVPATTFNRVFFFSVITAIMGMLLILRKLLNKPIIDIFRK
ncbi:MAG: ABC transporter permease, partial [Promethearchaeia archaeon]